MPRIRVSHVGDQGAALPQGGAELTRFFGAGARLERTGANGAGPYVYDCEGGEEDAVRAGWRALEATGHAGEWMLSLA